MRTLMISLNYAPEETGIGLYSGEFAQGLRERGHEVRVICAPPHFPQWRVFEGYSGWRWESSTDAGIKVTRCPTYVPAKVSGATRMAHYASFLASAAAPTLAAAVKFRPDLIFAVAPSLLSTPLALVAAKLSGARSWLHIQDFEVEAAFATRHLSEGGAVARAAQTFDQLTISAFDQISTISPGMCAKLLEKAIPKDRIYELRNWAAIERIQPASHSSYRKRWNVGNRHVCLYSGSIARKQGIEVIAHAARLLSYREDILFVVCGNGPGREKIEAASCGLSNVQIHDLQPKENLGDLLNLASVHLLPQTADAADLVLPSKLANMLASGRPVIAGVGPDRGLAQEVEDVGLICHPEDPEALASAICRLIDDDELHAACSRNARKRAVTRWSRSAIIDAAARRMSEVSASASIGRKSKRRESRA